MRAPNLKCFITSLILLSCLLVICEQLNAQEPNKSESGSAKATLFYSSNADSHPRWDLSEEPGVFRYVEQERPLRPHDKVVYIAYGPLGEVTSYLLSIDSWLKQIIKVDPKLVLFLDGGREKNLRYEVWLVPEGAEIPKVSPPIEDEKAIIEFTDYPYEEQCEVCGTQGRYALEALVKALKQRPQRKAYLEFYGCGSKGIHRSSVAHEVWEARRILIKEGGLAPSRILVKIKEHSKKACKTRIWLLPSRFSSLPE